MNKRIVIAGATGFIGQALCRDLCGDYDLVALSRDAKKATGVVGPYAKVVEWDGRTTGPWAHEVDGAEAAVNLAGESIGSRRWSRAKKADILQSRAHAARAIIDAIELARDKPRVFVQASAVGFYGVRGDGVLDENSAPGTGLLAEVCRRVEMIAERVERFGVRKVVLRTGVVLGTEGGALPKLMRPFRFHLGGHVGTGRQWFSWISLQDEVRAIRFLIEDSGAHGVFNLTGPEPETMKAFSRVLGKVMGRSAWTVVPGFVLRLAFGQMADEVLLGGQRVVPKRLAELGFEFRHRDAAGALTEIIRG
jgi:uncharacterized protein (TIGR01777 family)